MSLKIELLFSFIASLNNNQCAQLMQFVMCNSNFRVSALFPIFVEVRPIGTWQDFIRSSHPGFKSRYGMGRAKTFYQYFKQNVDPQDAWDMFVEGLKEIVPSVFGDEPEVPKKTVAVNKDFDPELDSDCDPEQIDSSCDPQDLLPDNTNSTERAMADAIVSLNEVSEPTSDSNSNSSHASGQMHNNRAVDYTRQYRIWHETRFILRERPPLPIAPLTGLGVTWLNTIITMGGTLTADQLFQIFMHYLRIAFTEHAASGAK